MFGLSVGIGNTIGSGILRTPGELAGLLGDVRLFILVWIAGALYAFLGANAYAELATMTPESGGHTVYVRRALGPYAGFVIGWSDWLSTSGSVAAAALVVGESAATFVRASPVVLSTIVVAGLAVIQLAGVRIAGRTQETTALAKTFVFIALIVACFAAAPMVSAAAPAPPSIPHWLPLLTALIVAMQAVIFTYDGYYGVVYFSGEVKNPGRDIPRSIFGGVALIAVIYLLVNVGFLRILGIGKMAGDPLVAATAAGKIFGASGDRAIRLLTIVSLLSAVNAFQLMASRVLYRLGARGFVRPASVVNSGGTPAVALVITTFIALTMVWSGTFAQVLALTAFIFVAQYVLDFASLLVLRIREPDAPRPFRARGHPWTTGGVLLLSIAFLTGAGVADIRNTLYSVALLALSYPIYLFMQNRSDASANV